jgi:ATP-dependent DNA helicase RecQ
VSLALWCYRVGWSARGWLPGRPLLGVPLDVRRALVSLAVAEGLPEERQPLRNPGCGLEAWTEPFQQGKSPFHPAGYGDEPLRKRLGWSLLERVFLEPPEARDVGEVAPWRWKVNGQDYVLDAYRLLHLQVHQHLRRLARSVRLPYRTLDGPSWERWTHVAPLAFRVWAMAWLMRLEEATAKGQQLLRIRVVGDLPLPILALYDSLALASAVNRLYGMSWDLPAVLLDAPQLSAAGERALQAYQGEDAFPEQPLDRPERATLQQADVLVGDVFTAPAELRFAWWSEEKVRETADELHARLGRSLPASYAFADAGKAVLDHFFQRFFPHPWLREEQWAALRRLLAGQSLLVLLPTGYGKSAIFQLPALIQPGTALVIAPLNSLIQDQIRSLQAAGITGVAAINSRGGGAKIQDNLARLREGSLRLCYVTPERLQNEEFRRTIPDLIQRHRFSLVAVDEAHCVSEWGHDFRTAYQHVLALRNYIVREQVLDLPMVALTATASRMVRAEILHMLDIPPENVVQSRSSDRPELSFSVHVIDGAKGAGGRMEELHRLITRMPQRLPSERPGLLEVQDGGYSGGAIVFVPFADAHNRATYQTSAGVVAEWLEQELPGTHVGLFASNPPRRCPHCDSFRFHQDFDKGVCATCGTSFPYKTATSDQPERWEQQLASAQANFLSGQQAVLVATKGFGMGVDKPDVRLVVHLVTSGSMEGYHQEAGRAGRDGKHAHVALIVVPPAERCLREHIREERWLGLGPEERISLPCLEKNRGGYPKLKCPYGLTELCDVGQQAHLIDKSFPGLQKDLAHLKLTHERIDPDARLVTSKQEQKNHARDLTRLQQLGVIEGYAERRGPSFQVRSCRPWDYSQAVQRLEDNLRRYARLTGLPPRLLQAVDDLRHSPVQDQRSFVESAGRVLLEMVYTVVRGNRLVSLLNLHRYATLGPGRCRRAYLRSHFDVASLRRETNCGFCDGCVPNLNFTRERAKTLDAQSRDQELAQLLDDHLDHFDLAGVLAVFHMGRGEGYGDAIRRRADQLLEQKPVDPRVLFLVALTRLADGESAAGETLARRALAGLDNTVGSMVLGVNLLFALAGPGEDLPERVLCVEQNPLERPGLHDELVHQVTIHAPALGQRLQNSLLLRRLRDAGHLWTAALRADVLADFLRAVRSTESGHATNQ